MTVKKFGDMFSHVDVVHESWQMNRWMDSTAIT